MGAKQDKFIKEVGVLARAEYLSREAWVLPSVCIAQGALESGWNLEAQTLFGIKASPGDDSFIADTKEFYDGNFEDVQAAFKAYPNIAASVAGYYDLITGLSRYRGAVNNSDYISTVKAIASGGYATDPAYADKVISIIRDYNLTEYDTRDTAPTVKKTNEQIAQEVIQGEWGNGEERKQKLTAAGYDYNAIQDMVDKILGGAKDEAPKKSDEEIAQEVIEGKWGNGSERKEKLTKAGYDYEAIQDLVDKKLAGDKKPSARRYTVKPGDNLWNIALRYLNDGTRYTEIKKLNGLANDTIYPGQELLIPNK